MLWLLVECSLSVWYMYVNLLCQRVENSNAEHYVASSHERPCGQYSLLVSFSGWSWNVQSAVRSLGTRPPTSI